MRSRFVLSLILVAVGASAAMAQRPQVRIETPKSGGVVEARDIIAGLVSDKSAQVWVVVRPRVTREYWVQPAVEVDRKKGTWQGMACFGEEGQHHGARYDVAAVVNPSFELHEGMILRGWPRCQAMSAVMVVTRR